MSLQMPLLLVVMAIAAVYSFGRKTLHNKRNVVILITVILALFSGLRTWWMGDLIKYYTLYVRCAGPDWYAAVTDESANVGIRWFFRCASLLGISYDNCILIIAVFVAATLGLLVYRYSPSPYWSYLMYIAMGFYIFTYSGLKQTIAMAFLTLAVMAMLEGRFWHFLLWVLIGSWFHAPAMIFLIAYPFCRQQLGSKHLFITVGLFAIIFLMRNEIVSLLSELYYDDQEAYAIVDSNEVGGRFVMMILILILGLILRPLRQWDRIYVRVFNLMILAAALQTMSVFDSNFTRLTDYYYQFVVLFMPLMLETGQGQARAMPERRHEIRYWATSNRILLGLGVTAFALWFYGNYIDSCWAILNDFVFRWEIDPYSLYGH